MKLLSYELDKDILNIVFESNFSNIRLRILESPEQIIGNSYLALDFAVIQVDFSIPKSGVSLCLSSGTRIVILIIEKIDGCDINDSIMISRELESNYKTILSTKLLQKNESKGVHATIRRKITNGNR